MALILQIRGEGQQASREFSRVAKEAGADIRKLEGTSKAASTSMVSSFKNAASFLAPLGIALGARQAVRFIGDLVKETSKLEESLNAVNVVFGSGAGRINEFGRNAAENVGLAQAEFNQLAVVTGALLKDVGLPMDQVAKLTTDLTIRAADLASVFDTDVQDALGAINQAIRGETEAIRRYAGDITNATLEQFAFSQGIDKTVSSMTEQEKRLLRVQVIMQQTDIAAGDFANTSDTLANATRRLNSNWTDLKVILGQGIAPNVSSVANGLNSIVLVLKSISDNVDGAGEGFYTFLGTILTLTPGMAGFAGTAFETARAMAIMRKEGPEVVDILKKFGQTPLFQNATKKSIEEVTTSFNQFEAAAMASVPLLTIETEDATLQMAELGRVTQYTATVIPELPQNIRIVNRELEIARSIGEDFSQTLARAVFYGGSLSDVLRSVAVQSALSFLPGGSFFSRLVPGFQHGTNFSRGGPAIVGERGPELVNLPAGSKVTPNQNFTFNVHSRGVPSVFEIKTMWLPLFRAAERQA